MFLAVTANRPLHRLAVELSLHELHVRPAARGSACPRERELSVRAIDRHHPRIDGGEDLEQPPVPGPRVHRELRPPEERRERAQIRPQLRRHDARRLRLRLSPREELPRQRVPGPNHVRDAREAPVRFAKRPPARDRVRDHRVVRGGLGAETRTNARCPCFRTVSKPACLSGAA